jgi:hypothetical protein
MRKIEWKIKICTVKIAHFINISRTLVVIFMILEKSLFVSSVLKSRWETITHNGASPLSVKGCAKRMLTVYSSEGHFTCYTYYETSPAINSKCWAFVFYVWELFKARPTTDKKLMLQSYNESRWKSSFRKFHGRCNDLVCYYKSPFAHKLNDLFHTLC